MCLPNAAKELHARAGQPNLCEVHLRTLFAEDPQRGERIAVQAVGLFLDYSKNRMTDETLKLLVPGLESRDEPALAHNSSTNNLIRRCRKLKEAS
jgi:hypothetical protein